MKVISTLAVSILLLFSLSSVAQNINTIIGGFGDGGMATAGKINGPSDIAIDKFGNLFVADKGNSLIRKINSSGIISTVYNSTNATWLAVDTFGNLYVSLTTSGGWIVKITPSGVSSIYAGGGSSITDGVAATNARLTPSGIFMDKAGNLYISDEYTNRIRKVDTAHIITTVAGNGTAGFAGENVPATSAQLNQPLGICLDNAGNLYIADNNNNKVRKVNSSGIITTFAGNGIIGYAGDGLPATGANFNRVYGVTADATGNVYISDNSNNEIRMVNTSGVISRVAGAFLSGGFSGDGGPATTAQLNQPMGIKVDQTGNFYIADMNNNRIRKVNTSGGISTIAGCNFSTDYGFYGDGGPVVSALLTGPTGVFYDTLQNLYIIDAGNSVVRKVTPSGIITSVAGNDTSGYTGDGGMATNARMTNPTSAVMDKKGNLFICDEGVNVIRKVSNLGIISTYAGTGSSGFSGDGHRADSATMDDPQGIAIDKIGNLYIADRGNNRIRKIDTNRIITTIGGTGAAGYFGDGGPATIAQMTSPTGICLDKNGNIFFTGNARVRKIDINGIITTVAGGGTGAIGGPAIYAAIGNPTGVYVDKYKQMYISSSAIIYKVDSAGIIKNFAGNGSPGFLGDNGPAVLARISHPPLSTQMEMTVDSTGNFILPDVNNNRIRRIYNATVTVTTPHDTVCTGTGATFTASIAVAPVYTPYFHWLKNNIAVGTNSNSYTAAPLINNDKIECYITDGATGPTIATSNQIVIYVPSGAVSVSFSATSTSVCQGTAVTCTPSISHGGSSPRLQWYLNGTLADSTTNYTFVPNNGDYVYCVLTTSLPCISPNTDTSSVRSFATYINVPVVHLTATTGFSVCESTLVKVIPHPTNGGTAPIFKWFKNGVFLFADSNYSFTPVNGDMVYCIMESNATCISTDTGTSETVLFAVSAPQYPTVSIEADPADSVCPGTTVTLRQVPVLGGTAPTFKWYKNGSVFATGINPSFVPLAGDVVYCRMKSNSGCVLADTAMSDTITFSYKALVLPSVSVSLNPGNVVCQGKGVTCTATSVNGGSAPGYNWYKNGSNAGTGSSYYFNPGNNDTVFCKLTSNATCLAKNTDTSGRFGFIVNATVHPTLDLSFDPGTILCNDVPVTITPQATGAGSSPEYDWYLNGNYVLTADQYSFTPLSGDKVYSRLRSNADCASPSNVISSTQRFQTDSIPTVTIQCDPGLVNFRGTMVTFNAYLSHGYGTYSYQWFKNDIAIAGATSQSYSTDSFAVWDSVKCVVTTTGSCSGTSTSNTLVLDTYHGMTLYPNPNNGDFVINGNNFDASGDNVNIRIFNAVGKLVYETNAAFDAITFYTHINIGHQLPPGVYLLRLKYAHGHATIRFVIK